MQDFRSLLDGLKTSTYEVLAILLPGVLLAHLALSFFAVPIPGGPVGMLVSAYIIGTAVQGLASWVVSAGPLRALLQQKDDTQLRSYVATIVRKRLDDDVPAGAIFDICLTRIGAGRQVYDKFVALRDAARGLAVASFLAAILVVVHLRRGFLDSAQSPVAVLVLLGAVALFFERHRRFAALGTQIVYGQFIAAQLDTPGQSAPIAVKGK